MGIILIFSILKVVATLPWIEWVAKEIGKDKIEVYTLVDGRSDPHYIYAKPSMIIKMKNADIILYNGLDLEIGYLPYLLEKSGNPKILPGAKGNIDLSKFAPLILEKPKDKVTRAMGDVHPFGNPHYHLDPFNIIHILDSLAKKFSELDPSNSEFYIQNALKTKKILEDSLNAWIKNYEVLKDKKFISYHKLYEYIANRFGFSFVDYIEPKPGIPPSPAHINNLISKIKNEKVELILSSVYYDKKAPEKLSKLSGIKYVILPHDIRSIEGIDSYLSLIKNILEKIKREIEND